MAAGTKAFVQPFRVLLLTVSRKITKDKESNLRGLLENYEIPARDLEGLKDPFQILINLENSGKISPENLGLLKELLTHLQLKPLADLVETFETKQRGIQQNYPSTDVALSSTRGLSQVKTGHVMISYSWHCQELVIPIKERLTAAGFNIWIDFEQMSGFMLEEMAEAVEKAEVVLICMSKRYKDSQSCRTEASYAHAINKPLIPLRVERGYTPDGWLGILIETQLYFDFSDLRNIEKNTKNLIRELGDRGRRQ